jgi:hypothetical protein
MSPNFLSNRRRFLTGASLTAGMYGLNLAAQAAETKTEKDPGLFVIGPKPPSRATTSTTTSTSSTRPVNTPSPNSANEMTSGSYPPIQSNSAAATR